MDKFSAVKYDRRKAVFAAVRAGASALKDAVETSSKLREWDPNNIPDDIHSEAKLRPFKGLQECESYMERYSAASLDALANERIAIGYSIFGDIKRDVVLGANTVGVDVEFDWEVSEVMVTTYNGKNREAQPVIHAKEVLGTGGKERSGIQKATGWDRKDCDTMSPDQVSMLRTLLLTSKAGYNKYTRLVKGMLIYLDLLHHGPQKVTKKPDMIQYTMGDVLGAYRQRDRAYVFCSDGSSFEYITVMMSIGEQYPNPDIVSYCDATVPSDAGRVTVVVNGNIPAAENLVVTLTPQLVLASLMKYAEESWCSDELESAMVCACSLYENRYLMKAALPRVVSTIDLILPAMMKPIEVRSARPHVTVEMVSTVGKLHQMCMFLTIKDVLMAAKAGTKAGFNYAAVVRQYLTTQEEVIGKMSGKATPLTMLEITPQMKWMYMMEDDELAFLDGVSIFEALWLCDGGLRSVRDGGITVLKKGVLDMMGNNPYREIVDKELRKTNIVFDFNTLPKGNFTISSRYIRDTNVYEVPKPEFNTIQVQLAFDCDYQPNDDISKYNRVRTMRLRSKNKVRRVGEVVEGERLDLKRVRTRSSESGRVTSGELSSILSERSKAEATEREELDRWKRASVKRAVKSVSPPRGIRVIEEGDKLSTEEVRSEGDLTDSVDEEIDIRDVITRTRPTRPPSFRFGHDVIWKLREAIEESKLPGVVVERKEIKPEDVEITRVRTTGTMELVKGAKNYQEAFEMQGLRPDSMIGGLLGAEFLKVMGDAYTYAGVTPAEAARLAYILEGVESEVDVTQLSVEDIKHVVGIRDAYVRSYRSSESGASRRFGKDEGKLLTLELNIRRGRVLRKEGNTNENSGIVIESRIKQLAREFYLSRSEISIIGL